MSFPFDDTEHLTDEVLRNWLFDRGLTSAQRQAVAEHLDTCPECPTRLESLQASVANPQDRPFASARQGLERGSQVGPYQLLQRLGEGGMGTVWMAEQQAPVRRRVALKIIRAGFDSSHILARFEQERQALALMDHPHIAKILDAGATEHGHPYVVMELVKGLPITKYCDQEHLTPLQRLELFIPVCQAVQHAHQKGIIHRDLKPSNVLVGLYDGKAVPKVIDFGVAKATGSKLTERTMFTEVGQVVGTVEYMAPEQAELNNLDIDTRADIYSLGVLLYELLTGSTPFTAEQLRGVTFNEMLRLIRDVEPPRPSTKLSSSVELPALAARRKQEPQRLARLLRGELDWIVMKCLEKERSQRYETANSLALDLQRYLSNEPVLAGPPSPAYRLRKFVRRNRGSVLAAGVVFLALALGMVGTLLGLVEARRQRDAAEVAREEATQEKQHAEKERGKALQEQQRAEEEAKIAQAVNDFLNDDLLAQADPGKTPDPDVKLRTVLDRAAATIEKRFSNQPLVEARVRNTLGSTYLALGEYALAEKELRAARTIYARELPAQEPKRLRSNSDFAFALYRQGKFKEAREIAVATLEMQKRVLGIENGDTLLTMIRLAFMLDDSGRYEEARQLHEEVLAIEKCALGETNSATLMSMNHLAVNLKYRGLLQEARKLLEETLAIQKRGSRPGDLGTLNSMNNLASVLDSMGNYAAVLKLAKETLVIQESVLRPNHPETLNLKVGIAHALFGLGKNEEARALYEEVLAIQKRVLPDHHSTLITMRGLANVLASLGRFPEARKLLEETLATQKRTLEAGSPETVDTMRDLAIVLEQFGQSEESLKLKQEILAIRKAVQPPSPLGVLEALQQVALSLSSLGHNREACQMFEESLAVSTQYFQPKDPVRINAVNGLAWFLATVEEKELRDPKRAVQLSKGLVDLLPQVGACWNSYGVAQYRDGDWKIAVQSLTKSIALAANGGDSNDFFFLAMADWQLGQKEEARKWYAKAVQWMKKFQPKNLELMRFRAECEELMGMKRGK